MTVLMSVSISLGNDNTVLIDFSRSSSSILYHTPQLACVIVFALISVLKMVTHLTIILPVGSHIDTTGWRWPAGKVLYFRNYPFFFVCLFVYCSIPCDTDLPLRQVHQDEKLGKGMV